MSRPVPVVAAAGPPHAFVSTYPPHLAARMQGRMCAGFKGGDGNAHHLVNERDADGVYLEIGDRRPGDGATFPDDDIAAVLTDGRWRFTRKDGTDF